MIDLIRNPVIRYLVIRATFMLIVFFVVLTIIFLLPRALPGNPISSLLVFMLEMGSSYNPEQLTLTEQRLIEEFGLNKPLYEQYVNFITSIFKGNLGESIRFYPNKVTDLIFTYLPYTLGLLIPASITSWTLGNILGVLAAYKRKTIIDNGLLIIFLILARSPYYWMAMLLIFFFAVKLKIFPPGGAYSPWMPPSISLQFIIDYLYHYILPFLAIVLASMGVSALIMRSFSINELKSDYMIYADSLGLPDRRLVYYTFRNAVIPQVVHLALSLGLILEGSLITELIFNYPGTGYILYQAIVSLDYPLIQGIIVLVVSTLLLAMFILDIVLAYIDPRIRLGYER